jgi:MarR family
MQWFIPKIYIFGTDDRGLRSTSRPWSRTSRGPLWAPSPPGSRPLPEPPRKDEAAFLASAQTALEAVPWPGFTARLRVGLSAFRRRVREAATEGDLSAPQLTALSRIDRLGPVTTAELARREQITPQAMGATIASLEQRGLVARGADAPTGGGPS